LSEDGLWLIRNINLGIHIVSSLSCMITFLFLMRGKKGTAQHIRLGKIYLVSGYLMAISATATIICGIWITPFHMMFLRTPRGPLRLILHRFSIGTTAGHVAMLFNISQAGKRLQDQDFRLSQRVYAWNLVAIAICAWLAYEFYRQGNISFSIFTVLTIVLLLVITGGSYLIFRESAQMGWRFFHGMSAFTSGLVIYQNSVIGGFMDSIANFFAKTVDGKAMVILWINIVTWILVFSLQYIYVRVMRRRFREIRL
jgi:hypothetical protein